MATAQLARGLTELPVVVLRLAWLGIAILTAALIARGWPDPLLRALAGARDGPAGWPAAGTTVLGVASAIAFIAVAILIAVRRPSGRFALVVSIALLLRSPGFVADLSAIGADDPIWAPAIAFARGCDGVFALLFLYVFPDGRFVPAWSATSWSVWTIWIAVTLPVPHLNPVLAGPAPWTAAVQVALAVSGLVAQVHRYRAYSTSQQQQQTKWVTYGLSLYVVAFVARTGLPALIPALADRESSDGAVFALVTTVADHLSAIAVAATIAIAILRQRLFDIDLLIGRTIVYFTATAIVAGIFGGLSAAAQLAAHQIVGRSSDALTVIIALAVGATFAPVKTYVQWQLDRRLGRRKLPIARLRPRRRDIERHR